MSDLDFLDLHAKLTTFEHLVRTNHSGCDTRFAQVVNDRLLEALGLLAETCRQAVKVHEMLRVETDPAMRDDLKDTLGDCLGDLESCGGGFYPWHLLDAVNTDPDFGGYYHPVNAVWCNGRIPEWMTVGDVHLAGLHTIIGRIAADTGIRFTTYLCQRGIGPEGAGGLDPEIYATPAGNSRYQ